MSRVRNVLKNFTCVALLCTAIALTYAVWSYTMGVSGTGLLLRAFGIGEQTATLNTGYEEMSYAVRAVTPLNCAVRADQSAGLYGTTDRETSSACFERMGAVLAEALATAEEPVLATSYQWRDALSGTMVFMDFGGRVPLAALARLLGARAPESLTDAARYVVLSIEESEEGRRAALYYKSDDRTILRCQTDADADYLIALSSDLRANGYRFAYEEGLADAREVLLLTPQTTAPEITAYNVLLTAAESDYDRIMEDVLEGFGFNAYMPRVYNESDGTRVYVEEERTLRVSGDGRIAYYDPLAAGAEVYMPDEEEQTACIAEASRLASGILASYIGDAELFLLDASYDEESELFIVRFGAECGSIRILTARTATATCEFRGGELSAANLELVTYRRTGVNTAIIPATQALAAAPYTGGFGLYYRVTERLADAGWYVEEAVKRES
ncbi:MAG: hypothetical protein VB111_09740 [Clostridiaceae bacterium]|nr:hypothetical protein [Clostridiaceae bacterium]